MRYLPLTSEDRTSMLRRIGAPDIDALFADVPADKLLQEQQCVDTLKPYNFLHEVHDFSKKENEEDRTALQEALFRALEDNLCDEFCRNKYLRHRQFIVVKELVAAGSDLSKHPIWCALNPLHHSGHHVIARELGIFMIAQGVDTNVMDDKGRIPLAAAAGDGDDNGTFVSALLNFGAAVSMDDEGNTPLHYVRQPSILKLLLANGANVASRNSIGWPLLISVTGTNNFCPHIQKKNHIEVCRLLLSCGAKMNACARDGLTVLHCAVSAKDAAITKFLPENGSDTTLVTEKGESALHCACKITASESQSWSSNVSERLNAVSLELLHLLLDHGANPEAQDTKERTTSFYTLKGQTAKDDVQQAEYWAVDISSDDDAAEVSVRKESYNVAVEACDLMIQQGANAHAQDKDSRVFRNLINKEWLLRPVADLHPEAPVSPRSCSGGKGGRRGYQRNERSRSRGKGSIEVCCILTSNLSQ